MRKTTERYESGRVLGPPGSPNGAFQFKHIRVIASNGGGWDHVSISTVNRCPTWEEMCAIKRVFFYDTEAVMQLHPPESLYVNCHPYCLHLWRPQTDAEIDAIKKSWGFEWPEEYQNVRSPGVIPMPPKEFVGPSRVIENHP